MKIYEVIVQIGVIELCITHIEIFALRQTTKNNEALIFINIYLKFTEE